MAQGRVTDFFSTRKRNRFNQDDILLNKQKRTQTVIDPTDTIGIEKAKLLRQEIEKEITTRSRSKQLTNETTTEVAADEPEKKVTRSSARKKQMEELKQRMSRLDEKVAKLKEDTPTTPVEVAAPEPAKAKPKKKVNMAELKAKIQSFNDNLLAAKENYEKTQKESEPAVAPADVDASAAFVKFKDLASADIDIKCTLTLPTAYSRLLDSFKGSDTIVKFLTNRQETCTFLKLKLGIQNITKHTFTHKNLGQIKTVYPLAYIYKQEKMFIDFKNDYHLTIAPNLEEIEAINEKGLKEFSPSVLLIRLNKFKTNLFQIVKKYHQAFLESLGISNVDFKQIKRWHPKFDLDSVAEIESAELPKSPNDAVKVKTGQDLLNIAKSVYSSRIQEAIKEYVNNDTSNQKSLSIELEITEKLPLNKPPKEEVVKPAPPKPVTADDQVLIKLKEKKEQNYSALLEKIRNKEKTKALESMIINSDKEKKIVKYGHYKESIRFLLFFFQSEKKSTIEYEKIVLKLADNLKDKLSEMECRELLNEMCNDTSLHSSESVKWMSCIKVRNLSYIKMDKSFQLNELWAKCDKLISEL